MVFVGPSTAARTHYSHFSREGERERESDADSEVRAIDLYDAYACVMRNDEREKNSHRSH